MQIACKRYGCQKAIEVCYWSCKFRKNCKDWEGALVETPGADAVRARLEASAKKSGRVFDPKLLVIPARKKKRPESGSISPTAPLESRAHSRLAAPFKNSSQVTSQFTNKKQTREIKGTMLNLRDIESTEPELTTPEISAPAFEKMGASKAKPKAAKPKPVNKPASKPANNNGPVYLLLFANGKYKELSESELNTEAAGVLKDQTLRLVKGQYLVPLISFKVADEE